MAWRGLRRRISGLAGGAPSALYLALLPLFMGCSLLFDPTESIGANDSGPNDPCVDVVALADNFDSLKSDVWNVALSGNGEEVSATMGQLVLAPIALATDLSNASVETRVSAPFAGKRTFVEVVEMVNTLEPVSAWFIIRSTTPGFGFWIRQINGQLLFEEEAEGNRVVLGQETYDPDDIYWQFRSVQGAIVFEIGPSLDTLREVWSATAADGDFSDVTFLLGASLNTSIMDPRELRFDNFNLGCE